MPASILFKFASEDFTDFVVGWEESAPKRINPVTTPREHGAKVSEEPTYEPRNVRVTLHLFAADAEAARTAKDDIISGFPTGRDKLYKHDDRYLNAYFAGIESERIVEGTAGNVLELALKFFCDDPFYYATAATSTQDTSMVQSDTLVVTNSGSENLFASFTIVPSGGTMTSLTLTNSTLSPTRATDYQGSVSAGNSLVINTSAKTVTNNAANDLNNWKTSGGSASDWIWLQPGANTITVTTMTGPTTISLTVSHTNRWI